MMCGAKLDHQSVFIIPNDLNGWLGHKIQDFQSSVKCIKWRESRDFASCVCFVNEGLMWIMDTGITFQVKNRKS